MGELRRMDGRGCSYYRSGRCTRTRSPEDSARARCSLLEARRKVGAKTLERLERLKLLADPNDRERARRFVLQQGQNEIQRLSCPRYVPSGSGPVCRHQYLVYCTLLLPMCEGRCEHYLLAREAEGGH